MKFCPKCENLYYITISDDNENKLTFHCRNCGFKDNETTAGFSVVKTENTHGEQIYNYTINEFTKYDPTLPRIYDKECINPDCKTNILNSHGKKPPTEIVYMRYDDANLRYAYICVECDTSWKTE